MSWFVYVLVSESRARTYVGISTDAERRRAQHNGFLVGGAKATRLGRPWKIGVVYGPYPNRSVAQRIERQVKRLRGGQRLCWQSTSED